MGFRRTKWYNHSLFNHRRKRITIAMVVILAAAAGAYWGTSRSTLAQSQSSETYYTVVKTGDIRVSASGSGTLEAAEVVSLSFPTAGVVSEIFVKTGESVTAGQELAKIGDVTELEAAVTSAQLALIEAQQALDDLNANAELAIAQAYQAYAEAQAAYTEALRLEAVINTARCSRDTNQQLYDKVHRAENELALAVAGTEKYIQLKQALATAEANLNNCLAYTDAEKADAAATLAVTELTRDNALETYEQLKELGGVDPDEVTIAESEVAACQSALQTAQENLAGATLVAPIDGVVTSIASGVGEYANGATFMSIANLETPIVNVNVDEDDLNMMEVGNAAEITFDAIPERIFDGVLTQVNPSIVSQGSYSMITGEIQVTSDLTALDHALPIGLNAAVEVISAQSNDVLLLNKQALRDLGDGAYAVFVKKDGKLQLQVVEVGLTDDVYAEITSGLSLGDVVSTGIVEIN